MTPSPLTGASLRDDPELRDRLLQLNNDHALELSWLDHGVLERLVATAFYAARCDTGDGLLIAFDQSAGYDSPNFQWFRGRHARFVYVDRIVTSPHARGRGLAAAMYRELFRRAMAAGHDRIVCEINSDPPNLASRAFHASLGFAEVGSAVLENSKTVSYMELRLAAPGPRG